MADPDHDRPVGAVARGPSVAIAGGCSGLESDATITQCNGKGGEAFRQGRVGQHVADIPGSGRAQQFHRRRLGLVAPDLRQRETAFVGEAHIEARHFERRHRGAAERDAQRIAGIARRQPRLHAGLTQGRKEPQRPDLFEREHGRDVQGLLQGAAYADGALMIAVEVARQPVAEAHRHIFDQRIGM